MEVVLLGLLGLGLAASLVGALDKSSEKPDESNSSDGDTNTDAGSGQTTGPAGENDLLSALFGDDAANEISVDESLTTGFRVLAKGGNDSIQTAAGDDRIFAGSGDDHVQSGDGDDRVFLADGNDSWGDLTGRNDPAFGGDDFVRGGSGADHLTSLGGADTLYGDSGDDTLSARETLTQFNGQGAQADQLFGGAGNDRIFADDGDTVTAGSGQDSISVHFDPGVGQAQEAAKDWSPVVITDFDPGEDMLEVTLHSGATAADATLGYEGRDGEEITLTYDGFRLATLRGVSFSALSAENVVFR